MTALLARKLSSILNPEPTTDSKECTRLWNHRLGSEATHRHRRSNQRTVFSITRSGDLVLVIRVHLSAARNVLLAMLVRHDSCCQYARDVRRIISPSRSPLLAKVKEDFRGAIQKRDSEAQDDAASSLPSFRWSPRIRKERRGNERGKERDEVKSRRSTARRPAFQPRECGRHSCSHSHSKSWDQRERERERALRS